MQVNVACNPEARLRRRACATHVRGPQQYQRQTCSQWCLLTRACGALYGVACPRCANGATVQRHNATMSHWWCNGTPVDTRYIPEQINLQIAGPDTVVISFVTFEPTLPADAPVVSDLRSLRPISCMG